MHIATRVWLVVGVYASGVFAQQTRPTTAPAADASTPRGALRVFSTAMRDGDAAAIKQMFIATTPSEQKMVACVAELASAFALLHQSAVKAYGEEEARQFTQDSDVAAAEALARIDSADVVVNGDSATVTYKDQAQLPFLLKKVAGQWKFPTSNLGRPTDPTDLDHQLAELSLQADIVREIAAEIQAGKFATAQKAAQSWHTRLLQAATSQPTTRPAAPHPTAGGE